MSGLTRTIVLIDPEHRRNPEDPEARVRYERRARLLGQLADNLQIRPFHNVRQALGWLLTTAEHSSDHLPIFIVFVDMGTDSEWSDTATKMNRSMRDFDLSDIKLFGWDQSDDELAEQILDPLQPDHIVEHINAIWSPLSEYHRLLHGDRSP